MDNPEYGFFSAADAEFYEFMMTRDHIAVGLEKANRRVSQKRIEEYDAETDSKLRFLRGQAAIPKKLVPKSRQMQIALSAFDHIHERKSA